MKRTYASLREHYHQSFSWKWVRAFWPVYAFCCACSLHAYGFLAFFYYVLQASDNKIDYFEAQEAILDLPWLYFMYAHEGTDFVFDFLIILSAAYVGYYWYKKKHDYALQALAYTVMIAIIDFLYWGGAAFICTQITKWAICPDSSFFTFECYGGEPIWNLWLKT